MKISVTDILLSNRENDTIYRYFPICFHIDAYRYNILLVFPPHVSSILDKIMISLYGDSSDILRRGFVLSM